MATTKTTLSKIGDKARITGVLPAKLANTISDALAAAIKCGMEPDEAACVAVAVVADYGRGYYGNEYLTHLSSALLSRANEPEPHTEIYTEI